VFVADPRYLRFVKRSLRRLLTAAAAILLVVAGTPADAAAPGDLDPFFGTAGVATAQIGLGGASASSSAAAVAVQPDGAVVVAGSGTDDLGRTAVTLARFTAAGRPDPGFGSGGAVVTQLGQGAAPACQVRANGLALQGDGSILVAGSVSDESTRTALLVARYLSNGAPDPSFGTGGRILSQDGLGVVPSSQANGIALQPDGRIVVAGTASDDQGRNQLLVRRYLPDGTPDPSFAGGGPLRTQLGPGLRTDGGAVSVQPDGTLLVALRVDEAVGRGAMGIARLTPDGRLDPSFAGGAGYATLQASPAALPQSAASALAVQADGRVVAGGWASDALSHQAFALARFLPDGGRDTGFGSDGVVLGQLSPSASPVSAPYALAVQANGKILQAGAIADAAGRREVAVIRYAVDGALDRSFAGTGVLVLPLDDAAPGGSTARAVATTGDGRLVVAGEVSTDAVHHAVFAARVLVDLPPQASIIATPVSPVAGEEVLLDASGSSDPDGQVVAYDWDLNGDGGFDDGHGPRVETSFAAAGDHVVQVRVTDDDRQTATGALTVTVKAPPAPPAAAVDRTRPVVTNLAVQPRVLRRGQAARIRFIVSEPATVTITFWRDSAGRRVGKACRAPTKANRHRPACRRLVRVHGSLVVRAHRGQNTLRFSGRVGGKKLAAARYRVQINAVDPAGHRAQLKRFAIRVKA
jgi:uncharacterized delta-60 repeat protein